MSQKNILIAAIALAVIILAGLLYWFVFRKDLSGRIVIPYIAHQKPRLDPHVPSAVPIANQLGEVVFDGLFNVSANPSGITYEDGLGEYMGIDKNGVVSVRLKPGKKWHSSYSVTMDKEKIAVADRQAVFFSAKDLKFTLRRIERLGSLSPDYILVSQAVFSFDFAGPDENNEIKFQFRGDRVWTENDIKEVLSFKILPSNSEMDAPNYTVGTGPYLFAGSYEDVLYFRKSPNGSANIPDFLLQPFIDNSTYTTEMKNRNINVLLNTPFGSRAPILLDSTEYFGKSSIATCFFALFYNFERLNLDQRAALRSLIQNERMVNRFFKIGTQQQRLVANYKGAGNNYSDYLNYSLFPSTSYYVEEKIVTPQKEHPAVALSVLPDTVRMAVCLNYDYREELADLAAILNDPAISLGRIKVNAVSPEEIQKGNYDAVLVSVSPYRSNFLFDLYAIFLREPILGEYRINLKTYVDPKGKQVIDESSLETGRNFFRLDARKECPEKQDILQLLQDVYGFMSTREIGDKQAYAQRIDQLDQRLVLGSWLFSLPSLAYFSTQFDAATIDMYGTASQLSTIEKWQERKKE